MILAEIFIVTFLEQQKAEDDTQRELACLKVVKTASFREIRVNLILRITLRVSLGLWILFHQRNQIISFKEQPSLGTIPTQIKTLGEERMLNVTTTSTTVVVNTNIQPQVQ